MKRVRTILTFFILAMCLGMAAPAFAADFSDLQDAINGANGARIEGSGRYGYGWNAADRKWDIEAWNDKSGRRNVQLNGDVAASPGADVKSNLNVGGGRNVNLDLNGCSITGTGTSHVLGISKGAAVTVTDSSGGGSISGGKGTATVINNAGKFNLQSGTVTAAREGGYAVLVDGENASMTTSGQISGKAVGIHAKAGGSVTVTGGTVKSSGHAVYITGANAGVTITGGTVNGGSYGVYAEGGKADINVTGGKISGVCGIYAKGEGAAIKLTGGTVDGKGYGVYAKDGSVTVENTAAVNASGAQKTDDKKTPFGYGVYAYGGSITVNGGNITSTQNGINTYGGSVTVNGGTVQAGNFAVYANGAKTDVDINGGNMSGVHGVYSDGTEADINVTGGTIEADSCGIISTRTNAVIRIGEKEGKTTAVSGQYGVYATDTDAAVTVSGGTVNGSKDGIRTTKAGAEIRVTGGTVSGSENGVISMGSIVVKDGGAVHSDQYGVCAEGGSVTVGKGGTVDARVYGVYALRKSTFAMSGGKVTGDMAGVVLMEGSVGTVSGGEVSGAGKHDEIGSGAAGVGIYGYQKIDSDGNVTDTPYGKTTLNVAGGKITGTNIAISGNGNVHTEPDKLYSNGGTVINITGGTIESEEVGIYQPQLGELNISDDPKTGGHASITGGLTGIEIRSGDLNVSGNAEITGKGDPAAAAPDGSGSTAAGVGIAVSLQAAGQPININISGGTITGSASPYEMILPEGSPEDAAGVNLNVTGGKLVVKNESSVLNRDINGFITGGMSKEAVAERSLGRMDWKQMSSFSSLKEEDYTGKVSCLKIEGSEYPYHVGYLTGAPAETAPMKAGDCMELVPVYSLNGVPIDPGAGGAVLAAGGAKDGSASQTKPAVTKWASGSPGVAKVDGKGVVTAVSAGTAEITATLANGETVTWKVSVKAP